MIVSSVQTTHKYYLFDVPGFRDFHCSGSQPLGEV